jgi:outer membrane immunogenic protein
LHQLLHFLKLRRDGKNQLNLGLGLSSWGIPVYIGLDHGISSTFSLGGEVSYRSYDDKWKNKNYNHSIIGVGINGNYHFNEILDMTSDWDFYAGLNLHFFSWESPSEYDGRHSTGVGLGVQVGGRYSISKNTSLNLEFGGGALSGGKFGFTFNM